ncbi:MAG: lipopolysaccharide transport periplasmic protein LptA [Burkholderiaceae bacterium]|nr:lipopolysaccharide transport periplasmic protein LptA [Burkholderiaceae bacterium]
MKSRQGLRPRVLLAIFGLALAWCSPLLAEKADRDKPTTIDSDRLDHDDQKLITIFTGNVVLTKGTLVMRGDRMELSQDSAGNYFGTMTGQPARFRQKREGLNEFMEGEALQLDYNGKDDLVILIQNAVMRRLEGDVLRDQVAGDRLTYDNLTEQYQVESGQGQARSRMFLMPRKRP